MNTQDPSRPPGDIQILFQDEEEQILKDIKPINCEYLGRPKIALSELGETCSKNHERAMELLDNYENETIRERLREYGEKAKMLNTRTELPVTRQDVTEAMKFHATDDEAI